MNKKVNISAVSSELSDFKRSIPDDVLMQAKEKYMAHESVSQIARDLEVNRTTLQYYVRKDWKPERDLISKDIVSSLNSGRLSDLLKTKDLTMSIVNKALKSVLQRSEPPSTKEALDAFKLYQGVDELAVKAKEEAENEIDEDAIDLEVVDPFAMIEEGDLDEDDKIEE